jgi:predicted DNA-binding antitoxin AbrB/MazE fold protein
VRTLSIQAIYEDGVLKPDRALPLREHEQVSVSVEVSGDHQPSFDAAVDRVRASAGMLGWTGDAETVERLAMDPDLGVEESP